MSRGSGLFRQAKGSASMAKVFPIVPQHPEQVCWGCDRYCGADSMMCGNGSERTQHPVELFGDDWMAFGLDTQVDAAADEPTGC